MFKQKLKHFLHKNFKISGVFSSHEFDQTDFGRIYFNLPKVSEHPKTALELARILKNYNNKNTPVTIRNTGHSVNGQTLTDGVQINIGGIDHVSFNKEKMEVSAGAGASWDKVLKTIGFPKYCPPVFLNNPGQQIHIGGTAAVGGAGPYSASAGGFWNWVKRIKLVTMAGEIIECSPKKNSDYFKFSLGGYGRIGVIAELTVAVEKSSRHSVIGLLMYHDKKTYYKDLSKAMSDSKVKGMLGQDQLARHPIMNKFGVPCNMLFLMMEADTLKEAKAKIRHMHKAYCQDLVFIVKETPEDAISNVDLGFKTRLLPKADLVYHYPKSSKLNQLDLYHPWSDYVVGFENYPAFMEEAAKIIHKYDMKKNFIHDSFFYHLIDLDLLLTYTGKCLTKDSKANFPLSLEIPRAKEFFCAVGVMPTVSSGDVAKALAMIGELTDLVYSLGGKRYLYGIHNLTKKQVEQQFGLDVINKWQEIKNKLDPKHLLNIGVIEHLD